MQAQAKIGVGGNLFAVPAIAAFVLAVAVLVFYLFSQNPIAGSGQAAQVRFAPISEAGAVTFDFVAPGESTETILTRATVTGGEVVFHTAIGDITGNLRKASGQFGSPPPQCTWLWDLKIPIPGKSPIHVVVDHCALQDLLDQIRNGDGLPPAIGQ